MLYGLGRHSSDLHDTVEVAADAEGDTVAITAAGTGVVGAGVGEEEGTGLEGRCRASMATAETRPRSPSSLLGLLLPLVFGIWPEETEPDRATDQAPLTSCGHRRATTSAYG